MAIYRLWRESDNKTFEDMDACDNEHAVLLFGRVIGVNLTLDEGPTAPPYMMGRKEKEVGWTKNPDIAVYETP